MTIQLLRLEAMNMAYIIDDTEDLSTRRSGGYMLLQAIRDIEKEFEKYIMPISTGASIGLFSIDNEPSENNLIAQIEDYLAKNKLYRHATFAITVVQGADFRPLVEQSISNVRWHQMRSLNFTTDWGVSNEICAIDEIRPAPIYKKHKKEFSNFSLSVDDRNNEGRQLRQKFYAKEFEKDKNLIENYQLNDLLADKAFTNDTESLSKFDQSTAGYEDIPFNLNGKMTIFYADGNHFGKIQQACDDATALHEWDKEIKAKRCKLLAQLLDYLQSTPLGKTTDKKLRFETLLWGGDEFLFILPAWLGLEFAQKFFEFTQDWNYTKPLKHSAGLVFASHAAPISQLQTLAKKLADHGKAADRTQNTLSWIVLESFDHAGDNMADYWQRNAIKKNGWQKLLLTEDKIKILRNVITPIKDKLPRSAMVRVIRSMAAGKADEEKELALLQRSYESVDDALSDKSRPDFEKLWANLTGNVWDKNPASIPPEDAIAWTTLMELWDYLLPDAPTTASGATQ